MKKRTPRVFCPITQTVLLPETCVYLKCTEAWKCKSFKKWVEVVINPLKKV